MSRFRLYSWSELSAELKRRRVYPVIAAYAVVAFIILQIGEITFEPLGLPNWVMIALIVVVVAGFPVAIVLAWIFDITPRGLQRSAARPIAAVDDDGRPSIAVLPFTDMSEEQDQGYFCEGVAEEILNALTKIEQLRVAARSSSFQYSTGAVDVRDVGEALGVSTILEGSVRKSENRLRITAQLVKVADGYHLWSKSFDEELEDVFAIQDEIATCIADSLIEALTKEEQSAIQTASSKSVSAYEYYLRGRQFFHRFRKMDIEFASQMFRQAIDIDDEFALAWAGYADCHSFLAMYVVPKPSYREKAYEASQRALELAPDLAESHASRGLAHLICDEYEEAEGHFKQAIELNPNLFEAYYYFARTRFHQGDMEMAADMFRKAADVNPEDYQSRCLRIQILRGMDRIDEARAEAPEAIEVLERHLQWNPDDARAHHLGAGTLVVSGDVDRAKRWLIRAIEMDPDDPIVLYNVACNMATFGEVDKAFEYLGRAIDAGTVAVAWMRNDNDLANLRSDPRFDEMLARVEQCGT